MKILFFTHTFPYPLNDGVRLPLYHLLKQLAPKHEIDLLCLNDQPVSPEERQAVEDLGVRIISIMVHAVPKNVILRLINTLFDPIPFFVRQFQSDTLRKMLQNYLASHHPDVIHVEYLSMAIYQDLLQPYPVVLSPLDAVSMLFERNIKNETHFLRRWYTFKQWRKVRNFEAEWIPKFDETMVVSPVDKEYLLRHCSSAKISVSPNGVDTDYFQPQPGKEDSNTILFRGVMNFLPNADAVRFFYHEIFPLISKTLPQTKLVAAGQFPPPDLTEIAKKDPRLVLTGYVPDLRDWMAKAAVIVSPMRIGSGIKNKILESMAMEKAIVATSLSCAGLNVKHGHQLLIRDNASAFAEQVTDLLQQPAKREELGKKARAFVELHHTWKKHAQDFEQLYHRAIQKHKGFNGTHP